MAIMSRGYGGDLQKASLVDGSMKPSECGDEVVVTPTVATVAMAVGPERNAVVKLLQKHYKNLDYIVSDDGWQNMQFQHHISCITIDSARGLGNGHLCVGAVADANKVCWLCGSYFICWCRQKN